MTRPIPASEITFHHTIDPNGKLFWWHGEPYRAIRRHHAAFVQDLFARGIVGQLVEAGWLVPSELTNWAVPGYALVLRHHKVPFNALATEWNAPMFRDAALALLDLERTLEAHGLMLQDGHTDNLLFEGARPVFVDFCSIITDIPSPVWEAEEEFRRNFLHPLRMMSAGQSHAMRWMLPNDRQGLISGSPHLPGETDWQSAEPSRVKQVKGAARSALPSRLYDRVKHEQRAIQRRLAARHADASIGRTRRLETLRAQIAALSFPSAEGVVTPYATPEASLEALRRLLARLTPATVLALGGREEAFVAARTACPTACFAADEAESERLYAQARAETLPVLPVRPLSRDAHDPAPWRSLHDGLDLRYRADLVLAMALALPDDPGEQEHLLDTVRRFTLRWALLDARWPVDWLRDAFSCVEPVGEPSGGPFWYLCQA